MNVIKSSAVQWKHNFAYGTTMIEAKYAFEVRFTNDCPYFALTGGLWAVFCEEVGKNWPGCNGTALYTSGKYLFRYKYRFSNPHQRMLLVIVWRRSGSGMPITAIKADLSAYIRCGGWVIGREDCWSSLSGKCILTLKGWCLWSWSRQSVACKTSVNIMQLVCQPLRDHYGTGSSFKIRSKILPKLFAYSCLKL